MKSALVRPRIVLSILAAITFWLLATPAFAGITFYDGTFNLSDYGPVQIWS